METNGAEWEEEYRQLLESSLAKGEIQVVPSGSEKRESPRIRINTGAIWVRMDTSFEVVDASVKGISFHSDRQFAPGETMSITLAKAFKIETEVIECKMIEADPKSTEARYLTRCRFTDEHSAVRFLVMLKTVEDQERNDPT